MKQNGSVILPITIIASVVLGVSGVIWKRFESSQTLQKWSYLKREAKLERNFIFGLLKKSGNCSSILALGSVSSNEEKDVTANIQKYLNLKLESAIIKFPTIVSSFEGVVDLSLKFEQENRSLLEIPLFVSIDNMNLVKKCHSNALSEVSFVDVKKNICDLWGGEFGTTCSFKGLNINLYDSKACIYSEGKIRYNPDQDKIEFCDSSNFWSEL